MPAGQRPPLSCRTEGGATERHGAFYSKLRSCSALEPTTRFCLAPPFNRLALAFKQPSRISYSVVRGGNRKKEAKRYAARTRNRRPALMWRGRIDHRPTDGAAASEAWCAECKRMGPRESPAALRPILRDRCARVSTATATARPLPDPHYPRRSLTGASPKALENALENAAADENPVRPAISAMATRVSITSRRAAPSRSLR
jgi:hypothetical protein